MTISLLSYSESAYSITLDIYIFIYEPFGLGRFAMDHSLTKTASRPLFAHVRRYAPQRDN